MKLHTDEGHLESFFFFLPPQQLTLNDFPSYQIHLFHGAKIKCNDHSIIKNLVKIRNHNCDTCTVMETSQKEKLQLNLTSIRFSLYPKIKV